LSDETIEDLEKKLNYELLIYLREQRGESKGTVAMTAVDNQNKRDVLVNHKRNRLCPICAKNGKVHKITSPPPAVSLEAQFLEAEANGELDKERTRLGEHADAVDMWLENREIERRIKQLDPNWRFKVYTNSWEGIKKEIDKGGLKKKKRAKEYVNIFGTKLIEKK
jgi:hypothetical protein